MILLEDFNEVSVGQLLSWSLKVFSEPIFPTSASLRCAIFE